MNYEKGKVFQFFMHKNRMVLIAVVFQHEKQHHLILVSAKPCTGSRSFDFFYPVLPILLTIIDCRLPALVNLKASTAIQLTANKKILELYQVIMDLRGLRLFTMMEATVLTRTLFTNQVVGEFFFIMEII